MGRPARLAVVAADIAATAVKLNEALGAPPADDWDDAPPGMVSASPVRVRCIVHTRPHTHERALEHGEEADVPADVAELMNSKGQVEYVRQ